ncbi:MULTISPECIES: hypothetical protein [unclassified Paracoccus (in: a-proteobacteria)]
MRLHDPQSGRIEIDGTDIHGFPLKSRAAASASSRKRRCCFPRPCART